MALSGLRGETQRILERLTAHGVPHAIVGDLAVSARTEPRFTRDVDVAVAIISDGEAERLIRALQQAGYVVSALVEQHATGRIATVRLIDSAPGDEGAIIDLLFASSGIEDEITATAEEIELFEGVLAPVATVPALIALKMLARDDTSRPQDRADLGALLAITTVEERADAGRLCALIEERGYDRGRDLSGQLAELERQLGVS
jgi:predicted nucleotidyltransferase